jgi:hypothetical protein
MSRLLLVLALVSMVSGCASKSAQPAGTAGVPPGYKYHDPTPAEVAASPAGMYPRFSPRARCFQAGGVWRPTAGVCEVVPAP